MRINADKELTKRLLSGDERSFDAFFSDYFPRIYRFALVRLDGDHDLAEETAQLVLCQALSKLDTYRGEAPLFSWLCTFARHEISAQQKARCRAQGDAELVEDDPVIRAALESLLANASDDPDVVVYQAELKRLVKVALDHLPSLYADSLECKYVHGFSVRDIATRIGKSEKATESVLTRARNAFRECFETLIDEEGLRAGGTSNITAVLDG